MGFNTGLYFERLFIILLSLQVAALQVAVNGGTNVEDKEFVVSTELLMRQLLKLDSIDAEGEAKLQRKAEVSVLTLMVTHNYTALYIVSKLLYTHSSDIK